MKQELRVTVVVLALVVRLVSLRIVHDIKDVGRLRQSLTASRRACRCGTVIPAVVRRGRRHGHDPPTVILRRVAHGRGQQRAALIGGELGRGDGSVGRVPAVKVHGDDAGPPLLVRLRLARHLEGHPHRDQDQLHRAHQDVDYPGAPARRAYADYHVDSEDPGVLFMCCMDGQFKHFSHFVQLVSRMGSC